MKEKLANHQWYHQRFDSSPMYLSMIGEAETKSVPKSPQEFLKMAMT